MVASRKIRSSSSAGKSAIEASCDISRKERVVKDEVVKMESATQTDCKKTVGFHAFVRRHDRDINRQHTHMAKLLAKLLGDIQDALRNKPRDEVALKESWILLAHCMTDQRNSEEGIWHNIIRETFVPGVIALSIRTMEECSDQEGSQREELSTASRALACLVSLVATPLNLGGRPNMSALAVVRKYLTPSLPVVIKTWWHQFEPLVPELSEDDFTDSTAGFLEIIDNLHLLMERERPNTLPSSLGSATLETSWFLARH